jgi:putative DNA primase/helicase
LTAELYNEFGGYPHDPKRDRELAKECLPYLSRERCDEYAGWLNVGIALCNIFGGDDEGLDLWREWSQQSRKYIEGDCDTKWDTFGDTGFRRSLTVGSLIMWARDDSPEYRVLEEKRRTERRLEMAEQRAESEQHTDLGNARRLVSRHGDNIRYDYNRKLWFVWDGTRWVENAESKVMQWAKETIRALYKEAAGIEDQDKRQALTKHALKSEHAPRIKATVDLARDEPEIQADVADFDSVSHLLNVLNGTLDLRTGDLRPHSREDMLTKLVPIKYDAHARCPQWDAFLARIFNGNQNLIRFMRRAIGYTLTGETGEQCMFVLHGTGANGKSTLLEVVAALTAGYGVPVRTEALMKHKWTGASGHSEDIANLRGARFVSAVETEAGQKLAESLLKQITGGDTITASRKHEHSVTFRPVFKLWLAANHKPEVDGTDEGIWRRIHLVPFDVTIPAPERDKRLPDKLRSERPGILSWCVLGAVEYYRDGLGVAEEVKRATAAYRDEQDTLSDFLADRCLVGKGLTAKIGELYQAYETWCSANGEKALNRKAFKAQIIERGFEEGRGTGGVRIWRGLEMRDAFGLSLRAA